MANIEKLLKQQEEIKAKIEEQKNDTHEYFGEQLIKKLGISYELLGTKKEMREVAELVIENMSNNPFSDDNSELDNDSNKTNADNNKDVRVDNDEQKQSEY